MELRQKIMAATDRVLAVTLAVLVLGSGLAFGGAVWWFPPAVVGLTFLMVADPARAALPQGPDAALEEPADLARAPGAGAGGGADCSRLPAGLARRVSPVAQEV